MFCPFINGECRTDCAFSVETRSLVQEDKVYNRVRVFCILAEKAMIDIKLSESAIVNHEKITKTPRI